MPPPKHYPRSLDLCFAADPLDPRFVANIPGRELTPLGVCVNVYWWVITHPDEITPVFRPIIGSLDACLERECPDTLAYLTDNFDALTDLGSACNKRDPG